MILFRVLGFLIALPITTFALAYVLVLRVCRRLRFLKEIGVGAMWGMNTLIEWDLDDERKRGG